jgi:hypothetical protein
MDEFELKIRKLLEADEFFPPEQDKICDCILEETKEMLRCLKGNDYIYYWDFCINHTNILYNQFLQRYA